MKHGGKRRPARQDKLAQWRQRLVEFVDRPLEVMDVVVVHSRQGSLAAWAGDLRSEFEEQVLNPTEQFVDVGRRRQSPCLT